MRQFCVVALIIAAAGAMVGQVVPKEKPQSTPEGYVWNQEPDSFRGIRWESSEKDAMKIGNIPTCLTVRSQVRNCRLIFKLGTANIKSYLNFENDRFIEVFGSFDSSDYPTVRAAFIDNYGMPTEIQTKKVQNRMNATFEQEDMTWHGKTVHITLSRFGSTLTEGLFSLETAAHFDATMKALEAEKANLKNGL